MQPIIQKLLAWYRKNKRELPWRRTTDPYAIFISELMLQQTQVDRVIPKYKAWLERFPNWKKLATASTPDIIHAWSGLGYNRRGLYARDAAKQIVTNGIPTTLEGWREIKGVGPYMAAAIMEFAQHERAVVLDTNVRRVAGRLFVGDAFPSPVDDKKILPTLDEATPKSGEHWDLPQAFMDFANAVCLHRSPKCATCPLRNDCKAAWYFLGTNKAKPPKKISTERVRTGKKYPDRIYRGRILKIVLEQERVGQGALGPLIDETYTSKDAPWVQAMLDRLVADGLLARSGKHLTLPNK